MNPLEFTLVAGLHELQAVASRITPKRQSRPDIVHLPYEIVSLEVEKKPFERDDVLSERPQGHSGFLAMPSIGKHVRGGNEPTGSGTEQHKNAALPVS